MKRLLLLMVSFLSLSMAFCQNSAEKQTSADRLVWSVRKGYSTVHLYKNELDKTIYSKMDEIVEGNMRSYTNSEYAIEGGTAVLAEFQNTMSLLSEKQLDMMLGEYSSKKTVVVNNNCVEQRYYYEGGIQFLCSYKGNPSRFFDYVS